jgi:hypothetical protein
MTMTETMVALFAAGILLGFPALFLSVVVIRYAWLRAGQLYFNRETKRILKQKAERDGTR